MTTDNSSQHSPHSRAKSTTVRFFLTLLAMMPLLSTATAQAQDIVLDRIRAVVNEGVVLDSDVSSAIEFFKQEARSNRQQLPPDDVLSERVLDQLIDREIMRQHASQIGVAIDASSVNRAIEQIARSNNMDSLQFRQTIQSQGFSYDNFRGNIEHELLQQRLIEREVQSRIRISAQEIDDYIDAVNNDLEDQQRYRIQHILIAVPPTATQAELGEAQARAQTVIERLRGGDDFSEVAAGNSDGARALQGGDLGWRTLQEVPEFLASALRDMNPGDISEPLRSANGLHIIRLSDRQSGDQTRLDETLVRHIFLAGDAAEVEQRIQDVRARLLAGGPFKELAASESEDPNSAGKGGELPWFSEGQMPQQMDDMANSLELNEISPAFRTQFGWHVLEVLDRRTRDVDEEALRDQANAALRQSKVEQETQRWSRQLRDESFVDIRS